MTQLHFLFQRLTDSSLQQELLDEIEKTLDDARAEPDGAERDNPFGICESYWIAGNISRPIILEARKQLGRTLSEAEEKYLQLRRDSKG